MNILTCWIGQTDLNAAAGDAKAGLGPIASAVEERKYDALWLLIYNYSAEQGSGYIAWLRRKTSAEIFLRPIHLAGPTEYREIYTEVVNEVTALQQKYPEANLTFHISPGTPAMAAVWIILAKTRFQAARLIESSREAGVRDVFIPFDMTAEFLPDQVAAALVESRSPHTSVFKDIIHQSDSMRRVLELAQRIATLPFPVLIEGESGTGKELVAKAIHQGSRRAKGPFVPVNCGAIAADLIESLLFGYKKGSFTGATKDTDGFFQAADQGTLFLDEIGELRLEAQVKLLRAIQDSKVTPVGATEAVSVDVRIISATNRSLIQEVAKNKFRSDLFYRLAIAVLHLPPLRDRKGDIELLLDSLPEQISKKNMLPTNLHKKLSPGAKKIMLTHSWPGNVRELENTLIRANIWATGEAITEDDAREAVFSMPPQPEHESILGCPLGDGFKLDNVLSQVAKEYLDRALLEAGNNKSKAAKLLGFDSYQRLDYWLKRYSKEERA